MTRIVLTKRIVNILIIAGILVTSSCTEKQYTCQCSSGSVGGSAENVITARSRISAKNLCNNYSGPAAAQNGIVCNLKDE